MNTATRDLSAMLVYLIFVSAILTGLLVAFQMATASQPDQVSASSRAAEPTQKISAGPRPLPPIAEMKPTVPTDMSAVQKTQPPPTYAAAAKKKALEEMGAGGFKQKHQNPGFTPPRLTQEAKEAFGSAQRPAYRAPDLHGVN